MRVDHGVTGLAHWHLQPHLVREVDLDAVPRLTIVTVHTELDTVDRRDYNNAGAMRRQSRTWSALGLNRAP